MYKSLDSLTKQDRTIAAIAVGKQQMQQTIDMIDMYQ